MTFADLQAQVPIPAPLGITTPQPIDWDEFWLAEESESEFIIEPLFARGRQTDLYAKAKAGKSLLVLDMVAAAVTGRSVLGQPARPSIRVVYLDLEMTPGDLRERLIDLGYGPDDDLSGLIYYPLPNLPPLDTDLGGEMVADLTAAHRADLVVIDTITRVVAGEENSADTYRNFFKYTGQRLKAMGVALARLDHMGKEEGLGPRGSSAKVEDVDAVYRLSVDGSRLTLKRTHTRVPWMPDVVKIERQKEPHLRHVMIQDAWPAGTSDLADLLDSLKVDLDATYSAANALLTASGNGRRKAHVLAALRYRHTRP